MNSPAMVASSTPAAPGFWRRARAHRGFTIGGVLTLALLAAIVIRCIVVARNAKSQLDAYICVGVAGMLVFQIVSNVGMCLFVLPVVGLTLPFISYGGSSVVTLFIAMGMVSGIQKRSLPDWLR